MTHSATGLIRSGDQTCCLTLRRTNAGLELADYQTAPSESFNIPVPDGNLIVALDTGGVALHRIDVPPAKNNDLSAIVALQAELLTPLPTEEMTTAWRADHQPDGRCVVTLAAARTNLLETLIQPYEQLNPRLFFLNSQALVKAWRLMCPLEEQLSLLVGFSTTGTLLCLAQVDPRDRRNHHLIHQATLDVTLEDMNGLGPEADAHRQRLVVDLLGSLKQFGISGRESPAVYILAPSTPGVDQLTQALTNTGIRAQIASSVPAELNADHDFTPTQLHNYLIPLGLALLGLDQESHELDLCSSLRRAHQEQTKAPQGRTVKRNALITAALLLACIFSFYLNDVLTLRRLEQPWRSSDAQADARELIDRHHLRRNIARQRIDILELLTKINAARPDDILIDRVNFERGRPVSVVATTKSNDKLYQFQKALAQQKGIQAVKQTATRDEKKGTKATFTFDYKSFTKKKRGVR